MDAVAARAGVSKATIYVHFENKRALFEAIIHRRAEEAFASLEFSENITNLSQILLDLAKSFVGLIHNPSAIAMYRVVLAEATQQPDVGEAFYLAGPAYARRRVGDYFRALAKRGLLKFEDGEEYLVADLFLSMLAGDSHLKALFGKAPDADRVQRSIKAAIEMVLARYS